MAGYNTTENRKITSRATISALALAALAFSGVAAAEQLYVNESGWWRDGGAFNASGAPIQAVVDDATTGETIFVWNGSYTENVNVYKQLTLKGEGADVVTVTAGDSGGHVFEVTVNWVNISGFTVRGATDWRAGIRLHNNADHCNISENNASGNKYGIDMWYSSNNTLTSNTASSNTKNGISMWHSSDNTLFNNIANSNDWDGINLYSSSENTLFNNIANSNERGNGIRLSQSSSNMLERNSVSNNGDGITIWDSSNNILINNTANSNKCCGSDIYGANNTLKNNTISGSKYNFHAEGIQDIDTSNKINGKPIRYLVNEKDLTIDSSLDVGYLGIANSRNITVRNLILANNLDGILLDHSSDSKIENVTVLNCETGIYLKSSSNNIITGNNASDNYITGMYLQNASNNSISNNNVVNNSWGIYLWDYSNNNILTCNTVISNSHHGIGFFKAINNNIYLNNFNNSKNVRPSGQTNTSWNSTSKITYIYKSNTYTNYMGNYWSDYTGCDNDTDGIGDILYTIDSSADHSPLMQPWSEDMPQKGDLNGDGQITAADAIIALQMTVSGEHKEDADVSGDKRVTSLDALMILQAAAHAIDL